jgi:DNA-binding NarL/FixJ family response regulator
VSAENVGMSPPGSVGVLIVDDQAPFRRAAKMVLAATPGFDVIGEAESGERRWSSSTRSRRAWC